MLPIKVDMNWIPKPNTELEDVPPPLPAKDSTSPQSLLNEESLLAPPLPPKPAKMLVLVNVRIIIGQFNSNIVYAG